jgi:hypothetical protein
LSIGAQRGVKDFRPHAGILSRDDSLKKGDRQIEALLKEQYGAVQSLHIGKAAVADCFQFGIASFAVVIKPPRALEVTQGFHIPAGNFVEAKKIE